MLLFWDSNRGADAIITNSVWAGSQKDKDKFNFRNYSADFMFLWWDEKKQFDCKLKGEAEGVPTVEFVRFKSNARFCLNENFSWQSEWSNFVGWKWRHF